MGTRRRAWGKYIVMVVATGILLGVFYLAAQITVPVVSSSGQNMPALAPTATPTTWNLKTDYFKPTGWTIKQFKNYQQNAENPGLWQEHKGTTMIINRTAASPFRICGQYTFAAARWDILHNWSGDGTLDDVGNYWGLYAKSNVVFYFRDGYDSDPGVMANVIYIPGHYPVLWNDGFPDAASLSYPPFNTLTVDDSPPPGYVAASIHKRHALCGGWDTDDCRDHYYRPYIMMPSAWNFGSGNFTVPEDWFEFDVIANRDSLCTPGTPVAVGTYWHAHTCNLGNYCFRMGNTCEDEPSTQPYPSPIPDRCGDMIVSYVHEWYGDRSDGCADGPGEWDVVEKWYFQKGVGLVAVEHYTCSDKVRTFMVLIN